jgi:hypothetical protein
MSTVNRNAVKYGSVGGQGFSQLHMPVTHASFPIKQGELVYLDTSAHIIKPIASDANAATLAGVALQPSVASSNIDNVATGEPAVIVGWDVVCSFKTTAAETYLPGLPLYIGADAQTVTTVAGSNSLGRVVLPIGVSTLTGAAGVTVDVLVKSVL